MNMIMYTHGDFENQRFRFKKKAILRAVAVLLINIKLNNECFKKNVLRRDLFVMKSANGVTKKDDLSS